jgi:DNA helicase-2/ATP-dependent DNA helicase PcrA
VGITRAERLLFISYAASRMTYGQYREGVVSRFVSSIPAETMRSVTRRTGHRSSRSGRSYESAGAGSLTSRVSTSWSTPEPTPKKVPVTLPDYKVGNTVFHPKFGEGQITEITTRRDGDLELAVLFKMKDHGQKRLIASLANMDIIS